jgi:hypothetical protein
MSDAELCTLIDRESKASIGVEDFYARDRERALSFYMGEAKGDLAPPDVDGRSRVVSKTLMDTVEWAMPCLMRMFAQDDVIRFEPDHPDDDQHVEDASDYIAHLFYRKNNGFTTLHDAIKSALLFRMGVVKVYCDHRWEHQQEQYRGLSQMEVQALQQDGGIEVLSVEQDGELPPELLMQGMPPEMAQTFTVTARRSQQHKEFKCEGVPPEEIRIARDCRSIEDVRYIAHVVQRTKSDLLSEGWPKEEIDRLNSDSTSEGGAERYDRHKYDGGGVPASLDEGDESQEKLTVTEAYVRVDFDGDGIAEYRRILKAGDYIHENEVTDDHPFALFTPILMPYKVIGLSFYDLVEDLQRIFTALDRQLLDNAYLANNPRTAVEEGQVNLDDLLNPVLNGIVRRKAGSNPNALVPLTIPFVGNQILEVRQHFGQVHDTRSGVTEMNSALNSESLAKGNIGSEGVASLITQGQQRLELVARVLAEGGVKRMWLLLLKLVTQYQDRPAQMKINGRWLQIDPRAWKNRYDMTLSVGVGTAGRMQKLQGLQMIGAAQEKLFQVGAVSPENAYNLGCDVAKASGERQTDRYFTKPDPNNPPNQGPPEAVQVEQVRQQGAQQLAQVKAQTDAHAREVDAQVQVQIEQARQEAQAQQAQHLNELEAEREHLKLQNEMALEQFKVEKQMELELARAHIQQQTAIEVARINAEAKIASAKTVGAKDASTADSDVAYQEGRE